MLPHTILTDFLLSKGYILGPLLTSGGFSYIYACNKNFIAKITPLTINNVNTLIREASLLKYINNCYNDIVVSYIDDFLKKINDTVYQILILARYDGDLYHLFQNFKINSKYLKELKSQLFYKLHVMHGLGVAHYDIKEDNVLYYWGEKGIVYVYADLGLSRSMVDEDREVLREDDILNLNSMVGRIFAKNFF